MKLLREYIKELLLTESIDPKIMSMIDKTEEYGWKVYLFSDKVLIGPPEELDRGIARGRVEWGSADGGNAYGSDFGNCSGAEMVGKSYAARGLGPLLYDIAIEWTDGLMADRMEVSSDAENVWDKYMNSRPDIQAWQLDVPKDYNMPQLTPYDEEDDCEQAVPIQRMRDAWADSSLSKMYQKIYRMPVIDELEERGLLVKKR